MTNTPRADALLTSLISGAYGTLRESFVALYVDSVDDLLEAQRRLLKRFSTLPEGQERDKALDVLIAMLTDPDPRVCYWAIEGLVVLGGQRGIEPLRSVLERMDSTDVFEAATVALVDLGDVDAILPLLFHPMVNYNTHLRLKKFNSADLVRALGDLLSHPDAMVRRRVMLCIQAMKHPAIVPLLMRALDDENDHIRAMVVSTLIGVVEAVPALLTRLSDPSPDVRRMIVQALGVAGDPQAIPALLPLLDGEYTEFQLRLALALGKLGHPAGLALIHRYVASSHHPHELGWLDDALKALRRLGEPLIPLLLALDERQPIQTSVGHRAQILIAEIFAEVGDPVALPVLDRMGRDAHEEIRAAVQQAIEMIKARMEGLQ
jgi:HEAT repeat protein